MDPNELANIDSVLKQGYLGNGAQAVCVTFSFSILDQTVNFGSPNSLFLCSPSLTLFNYGCLDAQTDAAGPSRALF